MFLEDGVKLSSKFFTVYYNLIAALWFRCTGQPGSTSYSIKAIFFALTCEIMFYFQSNIRKIIEKLFQSWSL